MSSPATAAKLAGLAVDVDTIGDRPLSPEERYALKTHGVCAQAHEGLFMIRVRTASGRVGSDAARGLAAIAEEFGRGWIHLTTRQQVELHHVPGSAVRTVLDALSEIGLTTRSACGHTVRGVMCCPDAGVGLEEPFDCRPDAVDAAAHVLSLTPELDTRMPQRLNVSFGGCAACRDHAKTNDVAFVSRIAPDGELGYAFWAGGSLGKSAPALAFPVEEFLPRGEVLAALHAVLDVFTGHGDRDQPQKARLKFLIRTMGRDRFIEAWRRAKEAASTRAWPAPAPIATPLGAPIRDILSRAPDGGWSSGLRPQRIPGYMLATILVPLGDLGACELRVLADIADDLGDEHLYVTPNQDLLLRHVPVAAAGALRSALRGLGLGLEGADGSADVRVCTAGPVCSLALTPAQSEASRLFERPALRRNSPLRIHVSGCPNACAQHQAADIGFSGGRVTVAGAQTLGYQVWLGGDLRRDRIGRVAGRIAHSDLPAVADAIVGVWEALRGRGEGFSETLERVGPDGFEAQVAAVFAGRWEPGPEPEE